MRLTLFFTPRKIPSQSRLLLICLVPHEYSRLVRQPHLAHQLREPPIRSHWVKLEVSIEANQQPVMLPISGVKPLE
jgi:hypothetical protein